MGSVMLKGDFDLQQKRSALQMAQQELEEMR